MTQGEDWTTYRGDNARSGSTDAELSFPLQVSWTLRAPAVPQLAWASGEGRVIEGKLLGHRVRYDDAFRTAIAGGRVYYGSTVDHQLHCVDLRNGQELWTFFTGGPIRLAPTIWNNRVLFGSDDGQVYCLDAATGDVFWQRRAAPREEWLLARGEMISKWPVRTGVLVHRGIAYFGAGIFPHEDVYLVGVDVETGERVWHADNVSAQDAGRNDLSPQGYLLAKDDLLFVPSGRSLPAAFDLKTGAMIHKRTHSWRTTAGGVVGGTRALLADGQLYASGPHHFLAMTESGGDVGFGWFDGRQMVIQGDDAYVATGTYVARLDRLEYAANSRRRHELEMKVYSLSRTLRGNDAEADRKVRAEIQDCTDELKAIQDNGVIWKRDTEDDRALLAIGGKLVVGGVGKVTVYDRETGEDVWTQEISGDARGLAAVEGNLIVSTDQGVVACFSDGDGAEQIAPDARRSDDVASDPTTVNAAEQVLQQTGVQDGFCLVLGSQQGDLAYELAQRSNLKIYCVEPDSANVGRTRQRLSMAGLYGHRVTVHQWNMDEIPYANFFANLIVSEDILTTGELTGNVATLARHLKPVGGVLCLGRPNSAGEIADETLSRWLDAAQLDDQSTRDMNAGWALLRRGPLPGAGGWSHQYGNAANTAVSAEERISGDLGVLWYGDPGPDEMLNRHEGAVGPLAIDGKLIVQGESTIKAYDAYNGVHLWTHENPEAVRTGVFQNQNPGNLAAGEEHLFHFLGNACYQLDIQSGAIVAEHALPESKDGNRYEWGYVAVQDDLLFGTATVRADLARHLRRRGRVTDESTDSIFAVDLKTGNHIWEYQGKSISHRTIAIGPDKVCFIDSSITSEQREEILRQDKSELAQLTGKAREIAEQRQKSADVRMAVGVNSRTGEKLWAHPVDVTDCSDIGIGGGQLTMMYSDGKLVLCGANANGHYWRQFVAGEFERRRLVVLSAKDGYKLWSKDANYRHRPIVIGSNVLAEPWMYDLETGDQQTRPHPITGESVPWSIMRTGHHCGMLTGTESGMLLFRSGYTGFYDLNEDEGVRHFAGHRLGCWINAIAANGLVLIPEASAGCVCQFSIASTIVMEPREARRPWTIYSAVGAQTPVRHLALNLGAPGDRKDERGRIWLSAPRYRAYQETALDVKLNLNPVFEDEGGFSNTDEAALDLSGTDVPWLYTSCGSGLTQLTLPLLGENDSPAPYTVRLHFADYQSGGAEEDTVLRITLNGRPLEGNVLLPRRDGNRVQPVIRELQHLDVTDALTIQLEAVRGTPVLNAVEAIREGD